MAEKSDLKFLLTVQCCYVRGTGGPVMKTSLQGGLGKTWKEAHYKLYNWYLMESCSRRALRKYGSPQQRKSTVTDLEIFSLTYFSVCCLCHDYLPCMEIFLLPRKMRRKVKRRNFRKEIGREKQAWRDMSVRDQFWEKTMRLCDHSPVLCLCAIFLRGFVMLYTVAQSAGET